MSAVVPRRILVRCPNPVGDAVMATPAFRALRGAHPAAEIVVMGPPQHEGLLRGVTSFDAYRPIRGRSVAAILRRARTLAAEGFDWAVILPDSPRAALEAWLARVPRRAGYAREPLRRMMLTDRLPPPLENGRRVPLSMLERYRRITRLLGVPDASDALELHVHEPSREQVTKQLAAEGVTATTPVLLVTPGASFGRSKLWPPAHFARACDAISRRLGLQPVIVSAPNAAEMAVAQEVSQRVRVPHALLPPGSLEDLKAAVERCALLVTNDTGPRHVAVALGRPVVTLMGPTDPRHTHHLLERQRVLWEDVPCRPCGLKTCPIDHRCLVDLRPERAVRAAEELFGRA